MLYFDHAATTYTLPEVSRKMQKFSEESFGNPSSLHGFGMNAKLGMDRARTSLSDFLGCDPREIIFTSGGTESNNLIIKGVAEKNNYKGHIITSSIEHHSVTHSLEYLETKGIKVTYLPVDKYGMVELKDLQNAIQDDTILISIMYANNEIGTIQPIKKIAELASKNKIPFHTDAVQAMGSLPCNVNNLGVDALSCSAHKFYGPKGVGLLYLKRTLKITPQIHGGAQQRHMRAGTDNVPGIVGLTEALQIALTNQESENKRLCDMRDYIIKEIQNNISGAYLSGHPEKRLVNNVHFCFKNIENGALIMRLNNQGIAVASGSACTAGQAAISHVVQAINCAHDISKGALRISLGKYNTDKDIQILLRVLKEEISILRNM